MRTVLGAYCLVGKPPLAARQDVPLGRISTSLGVLV
jgi:hypothetical protein